MNNIDLAARPIYRLFLQALLVVVKAVPRAQIGMVIETQFLCIDSFLVFVKSLTKSPLKRSCYCIGTWFLEYDMGARFSRTCTFPYFIQTVSHQEVEQPKSQK